AAAARERARTALAAGSRAERQAADYLQQGPALAPGTAEKLTLEPELKIAVLATLSETCPAQRPSLLPLAGRLNSRRVFPLHFLKRRMAARRGACPCPPSRIFFSSAATAASRATPAAAVIPTAARPCGAPSRRN